MDYFIELKTDYFFNNLKTVKKISNCQIAPVIKSNAYGHGMAEIISLLKLDKDINTVCVVSDREALMAKKNAWAKKIIVMSSIGDIQFDINVEYFLYSFDFLSLLLEKAIKESIRFSVHIKLNCGMNRFGFKLDEISSLIKILLKNSIFIQVVGICTHLPRLNYLFNQEIFDQINLFNMMVKQLQGYFGYDLLIHPFSSKGINLIQKTQSICNMVRVGGALYGLLNKEQKRNALVDCLDCDLKQIMNLKAKVLMIQQVKKDEYVGYGENYRAKKNETIAIVSFGYGYGYSLNLLSAPITGYCDDESLSFCALIGMNVLFFDITHIKKKIETGDYITLTTNDFFQINAAHLSNQYIGGREYAFTAMLNVDIPKIFI